MKEFILRRFWDPLLKLLKQGITPEKLAWSVALGVGIGVFPVLGSTTLLCALAAWIVGLNQPAIQLTNYMAYPLQIILLLPFYRLGEILFHVPHFTISVDQVRTLIQSGIPHAIRVLWDTTLHAIAAWCLVAPVVILAIYAVLVPLFRRFTRQRLLT